MSSLSIALVVGALIAVSGVAGLVLQGRLPASHTAERSRDMIGGVVGLLTLLLALVLGLLIWTAYGVYNTQQTELQTIAARALEFDLEMRQYGPEGDPGREILRRDLVWAHEQFWGDEESRTAAYDASFKAMGNMNTFFDQPAAEDPGADAIARRRPPQLRVHRREPAPDVAASRDAGRLAADLRGERLVLPHVRRHGLAVAAERDHLGDARLRRRLGRRSRSISSSSSTSLTPALFASRRSRSNRRSSSLTSRPPLRRAARLSEQGGQPMPHYRILSDAEIRSGLAELPDWSLHAPNIEAKFELKTFRDAIAFIVEIAIEAEVMNHHPEFHNSYNVVSFSFCTHDAGMKITDLDIETAKRISALARRFQSMP